MLIIIDGIASCSLAFILITLCILIIIFDKTVAQFKQLIGKQSETLKILHAKIRRNELEIYYLRNALDELIAYQFKA